MHQRITANDGTENPSRISRGKNEKNTGEAALVRLGPLNQNLGPALARIAAYIV